MKPKEGYLFEGDNSTQNYYGIYLLVKSVDFHWTLIGITENASPHVKYTRDKCTAHKDDAQKTFNMLTRGMRWLGYISSSRTVEKYKHLSVTSGGAR